MAKKKLRASFTLRKDTKKKWLAALRSGKYKQTTSTLFENGAYCCLGVLCSVEGISDEKMRGHNYPRFVHCDLFTERQWQVPYKDELVSLVDLNDIECKSFKQIANIIERTVDTH